MFNVILDFIYYKWFKKRSKYNFEFNIDKLNSNHVL